MGKPERSYDYAAYQNERGLWIGYVVQEQTLETVGKSEKQALREIEKLHRETLEDDRKWLKK